MNWEDSRNNCLRYGGDMVCILNSSENDFIYTEIPKVTNKRWFWIGLFRNITTGDPNVDWIWIGVMAIILQILSSGEQVNQITTMIGKIVLEYLPMMMGGMIMIVLIDIPLFAKREKVR